VSKKKLCHTGNVYGQTSNQVSSGKDLDSGQLYIAYRERAQRKTSGGEKPRLPRRGSFMMPATVTSSWPAEPLSNTRLSRSAACSESYQVERQLISMASSARGIKLCISLI
jgi:hypothetical protein